MPLESGLEFACAPTTPSCAGYSDSTGPSVGHPIQIGIGKRFCAESFDIGSE